MARGASSATLGEPYLRLSHAKLLPNFESMFAFILTD